MGIPITSALGKLYSNFVFFSTFLFFFSYEPVRNKVTDGRIERCTDKRTDVRIGNVVTTE